MQKSLSITASVATLFLAWGLTPVFAADRCIEEAESIQSLTKCADSEITPLEAKIDNLFNELLPKAGRDPALLTSLHESKRLWNAYRNNECFLEGGLALSPDGKATLASTRNVLSCVKRTLLQRISELELLKSM